jgi:hypothetical protein
MTTARQWAETLLSQLNAPVTGNNVASMVAWAAFEGGHCFGRPCTEKTTLFNPLNTSQDWPGARSAFGTHIKAYDSWAAGIDATIHTLKNGLYNTILQDLQDDAPPEQTLDAVRKSPWGTTALNPQAWQGLASGLMNKDDSGVGGPVAGAKGTKWGLLLGAAAALAAVGAVVTYTTTGKVYGYRVA